MRLRAESKAAGHRSGWQKPLTAASPLLTAEQVKRRLDLVYQTERKSFLESKLLK